MLPALSLLSVIHLWLGLTSLKGVFSLVPQPCNTFEEYRNCGPKCPITCDTLNTNVCCDVTCVSGCFCRDGYMLVSNSGPRKCVPFNDCPKPGILEFRDLTLTVFESIKVVEIVVLRLNGSAGEISVGWRTEIGTAVENSDYVPSTGILTFPEGVNSGIIRIEIVDDTIREPDEIFSVILSDPTNKAEINPRKSEGLRIIIKDDDMQPGYVEVENIDITVPENFGSVLVTLVRVQGHDGAITIQYRTLDDTASGQSDYVPVSGQVTFSEGERRKTISISIIDDAIFEPAERFRLQFFNPTVPSDVINFRQQSSRLETVITVIDDDMRPGYIEVENINITVPENFGTILVTLNRVDGTDGIINIHYRTLDGTAQASLDYVPVTGVVTFNGGERRKTVSIVIIDDTIWEPTKSFQLQFFNPTVPSDVINFRQQSSRLSTVVTIIDNDMRPGYIEVANINITVSENFGTVLVTLNRLGGTDGVISIQYRTVDGTAQARSDYAPVTGVVSFNGGERRKTVQIPIIDDAIWEPTESFQLQFFNPSFAPGVVNFRQQSSRLTTIVTIIDNDMRPGYIEVENINITVTEEVGTILVTLNRLGGTDGIISIQYRTVDGTAQAKADYVPVSGVITFNGGERRKTVPITIIDDTIWEPVKSFQLQFFDPSFAPDVINFRQQSSRLTTIVTIIDNDMKPGYIEMELTTITVEERIGRIQVNLIRLGGTNGQIRIRYRTVDGTALARSDYVPVNGDVIFNDGESRKSIFVSIIDDDVREPTKNFQLLLFDPSAAPDVMNFRALSNRLAATIIIIDNDMKPGYLELEQVNITVKEDYGTLQVGIVRIGGTDGILKMKYRTVDAAAVAKLDYLPVVGDLVFQDGESKKKIDIVIVNDDIRESLEAFELQIFDLTAGSDTINFRALGTRLATLITIIDDDDNAGVFEFQSIRLSVPESIRMLSLTIVRKDGSNGRVTLQLRTMGSTATEGVDYIPPSFTVIFPNGVTEKTVHIQIVDDDIKEADESFLVGIFNPTNGGILGRNKLVTVVIVDDDDPSIIRFSRRNGILRDDAHFAEIPVIRENQLDKRVSVHYRTEDQSARDGQNYVGTPDTRITFEPHESLKTLQIELLVDSHYESSDLFDVILFDSSEGAILGVPSRYTVQLLDFRRGAPSVTPKPSVPSVSQLVRISFPVLNIRVRESAGSVRISIKRSGDLSPFSVKIRTADGTAVAGRDYRRVDGSLSFKRGDAELVIVMRILNDDVPEPDETFTLQLLEPSLGIIPFGLGVVTVTIVDDDGAIETPRRGASEVVPAQTQSGGHGLLIKCPAHLIMKVCADSCPPSCESLHGKVPCSNEGCIRGCFCPEGLVKENELSDNCVKPSQCPGGPPPPRREQSSGLTKGLF